jgi:hypothetical protein
VVLAEKGDATVVVHGMAIGDLEERLRRLAAAAKASEEQAHDDRDARNLVVEEADASGMGIRQIARATGLTPTHVQRIIVRMTADRQAAARAA